MRRRRSDSSEWGWYSAGMQECEPLHRTMYVPQWGHRSNVASISSVVISSSGDHDPLSVVVAGGVLQLWSPISTTSDRAGRCAGLWSGRCYVRWRGRSSWSYVLGWGSGLYVSWDGTRWFWVGACMRYWRTPGHALVLGLTRRPGGSHGCHAIQSHPESEG